MLSNLKNFFSKETPTTQTSLSDSFEHPPTTSSDATKCPFMNKKSQPHQAEAEKCPVTGKAVPDAQVDSDSQEEKPKGGCPFMGGTSGKKKNPNLNLTAMGYNEPFVSKFRFYLSESKMDFSSMKRGLPQPTLTRDVFKTFPIYLQHTIFFNGEDYKKVRSIECCSRFMAYEQLRQKGNKRFNKGKFYEALEFYERAMSLFKWLEYYEPTNQSQSTLSSASHIIDEMSLDELSENGSRVNIPLDERTNPEDPSTNAAFDELKTKYKQFFITYCDQNIKLYDGEQMFEAADLDMRKSLLIQIYLNMCAAYINTDHFSLAEQVCDEGIALCDKVSQLYFRKAQALSLRKDATIQQLELARQCSLIAIEKRASEKIFATANQNILKMLNLHDSAQAYESCRKHVEERITEVRIINTQNHEKIYERVKNIYENQQRIISEGRVPHENKESNILQHTTQMKILDRMATKYVKVIEFYTEAKNPEQVTLAKRQFQEILRIKSEVNSLFMVEIKQTNGELGGLQIEKVQSRIAYTKTYMAEQLYNAGKFNFTMLEWAIKEIVKEEGEERKLKEAAEKRVALEKKATQEVIAGKKGYSNLVYLLFLLPVLAILLNMLVLR